MQKQIKFCLLIAVLLTNFKVYCAKPSGNNFFWLDNELLHKVDGLKGMVDETSIYKMTILSKKTNKFQYGKIDKKTKARKPQHKFQSQLYTLKQLVELEAKYSKLNNSTAENKQKIKDFAVLLEFTKDKMMTILKPFLVDARGSYELMVELIKESCMKRNRSDSELLKWDPKNEEVSFKRRIKSFKSLDSFCTDLINLQRDIVYSCPKALSMYEKWLTNQRRSLRK